MVEKNNDGNGFQIGTRGERLHEEQDVKFYHYNGQITDGAPAQRSDAKAAKSFFDTDRAANILHLSDLHFGADASSDADADADRWFGQLRDDLITELRCQKLHAAIISGDIGNFSEPAEYQAAKRFLDNLYREFDLNASQLVIVPGNHDLSWKLAKKGYRLMDEEDLDAPLKKGSFIRESENVIRLRDDDAYGSRFQHFSQFYEKIGGRPYPLDPKEQIGFNHLPELNIVIVGFNSVWAADHHFKNRISIHPDAVNAAIDQIHARDELKNCLKMAVWHHPLDSSQEDRIKGRGFMQRLAQAGFQICLHGHIHKAEAGLYRYDMHASGRKIHVVGAGTFGAPVKEWTPGYPLQYNLLRFSGNVMRVETRRRNELNGTWGQDHLWRLGEGQLNMPYYDISLTGKTSVPSSEKPRSGMRTSIDRYRKRIFKTANQKRLQTIEKEVSRLWTKHEKPLWTAYHDQRHNLAVESALYEIIIGDNFDKVGGLKEHEWFALIAAAWLHEIGMIIGLNKKEKDEYAENAEKCTIKIRNTHHDRAVAHFKKHEDRFDLTDPIELDVIANLCRHHRIDENVSKVKAQIQDYNQGLIYAYLRLALLIHRDDDPKNTDIFRLLNTPGISWDTKFHWLKIKWMQKFIVDHKESTITIPVFEPTTESSLVGFLPGKIIDDMQEKFSKIRDTLIKGKISFFVEIQGKKAGTLADLYVSEMELIRSNIELEEKSSATEAYETILNTLSKFTATAEHGYQLIVSYYDNIEKVIGVRPCHTLIAALKDDLHATLTSKTLSQHDMVANIRQLVKEKKAHREKIKKDIQIHSATILSQHKSILLYGFSSSVKSALEYVHSTGKSDFTIYIAECRGKTQYNDRNRMVYNDGIYYLEKLIGFNFKKTVLIPDLAVANLFKRGKIDGIFFGANGIDSETGSFGHTCGHLAIAESAQIHNIPLYVIAEESKIHNMNWNKELNRDIKWMPNYRKYDTLFAAAELLNPREDIVDKSLIDLIITEKGIKTTKQIIRENSDK